MEKNTTFQPLLCCFYPFFAVKIVFFRNVFYFRNKSLIHFRWKMHSCNFFFSLFFSSLTNYFIRTLNTVPSKASASNIAKKSIMRMNYLLHISWWVLVIYPTRMVITYSILYVYFSTFGGKQGNIGRVFGAESFTIVFSFIK